MTPRPTSGSTKVRSSTSSPPRPKVSESESSATAAPASPMPAVLDETAVAEVLAEARDNVQFGTPDEWAGLAEPDGVDVIEQDSVERRAGRLRDRRQDRPGQGTGAVDVGRRSTDSGRRRELRRCRFRIRRGNHDRYTSHWARERLLRRRQHAGRRRRRDADGFRVQCRSIAVRVRPRQGGHRGQRPGDASARCHQARHEAHNRRARPVRDSELPRHHLQHAQRRERSQGSQPVHGPSRRERGQRRS